MHTCDFPCTEGLQFVLISSVPKSWDFSSFFFMPDYCREKLVFFLNTSEEEVELEKLALWEADW